MRAGRRPDAVIPAISAPVLVLLTADGPILVRAALRTRHGGAIEAFDFSGAMAQRAGIGWYGHVCSFSSVDTGGLRAALQLELYQIFSDMVMWSSGDARVRHHPCLRPAIASGVGIEGRSPGRHSSWRERPAAVGNESTRMTPELFQAGSWPSGLWTRERCGRRDRTLCRRVMALRLRGSTACVGPLAGWVAGRSCPSSPPVPVSVFVYVTATARDLPSQQAAVCFSVTNVSAASSGRRISVTLCKGGVTTETYRLRSGDPG